MISIPNPINCHLWHTLPSGNELLYSFDSLKNYLDEYHHTRDLKKCKNCGQLYFAEFYEEIDFSGGDDRLNYLFIPVDSEEIADRLSELSRLELSSYLAIILYQPPYDLKPYWNNRSGNG